MEVSRNQKPKNILKEIRKITESKGTVLIFDECTQVSEKILEDCISSIM